MSIQSLCFRRTWTASRSLLSCLRTLVSPNWQLVPRYASTSTQSIHKEMPVTGIWYVPDPANTDPTSVVDRLPVLPYDRQNRLAHTIFLATPGLASWFDKDEPFLKDAIERLYPPPARNRCSSTVAIVDNIPAPAYFIQTLQQWSVGLDRPFRKYEGIAICMLESISVQQDKGDHGQPALLSIDSYPAPINATIGNSMLISLTVPIANTLFINGSLNTAFQLYWESTSDGQGRRPFGGRLPLSKIHIPSYRHPRKMFHQNMPLYPLTVPRRVISSMGNVIREVEGDNGEPVRASAELEAIVPKFLVKHKFAPDEAQIQIFAKVMPPKSEKVQMNFLRREHRSVGTSAESEFSSSVQYAVPTALLLQEGRMYRVMSGGGGWGKKAGLLSLDPATNFTPQTVSETSMFPDPDAGGEDTIDPKKLGALVPYGHTIEFLAAKVSRLQKSYRERSGDHLLEDNREKLFGIDTWNNVGNQRTIFGVANEGDFEKSSAPWNRAQSGSVSVLPGCFGALSERGASLEMTEHIGLNTRDPKATAESQHRILHETRIDAPFALFRTIVTDSNYVTEERRQQSRIRPSITENPSTGNNGQSIKRSKLTFRKIISKSSPGTEEIPEIKIRKLRGKRIFEPIYY